MKREKLSLLCNIFVAAVTLAAWLIMALNEDGILSSAGLRSLKYFTVLSNILNGVASLLYALRRIAILRGRAANVPVWLHRLKYIAVTAVALTFLVVAGFFGPLYGWSSMYLGANLWFHLVLPVVSMLEFCLLDTFQPLPFRASLLTMLAPLLYGVVYLANLLINGAAGNDWYGFANWGYPIGIGIFAAILLATWGIALLLRTANRAVGKRRERGLVDINGK